MTQTTDIVLAGAGYMLAPGSYRRAADGPAEGRINRIAIRDFFGGQHRALQLERDKHWDSESIGPAYFGQGVEPWPVSTGKLDSGLNPDGPFSVSQRAPSIIVRAYCYVANGRYLYKGPTLTNPSWPGFTKVADLGAGVQINQLVYYQGNIACLCGLTSEIKLYNVDTNGVTNWSTTAEHAKWGVGYQQRIVYGEPAAGHEDELKMSTGGGIDTRYLDAPIANIALWQGKVIVATQQSLWTLGGQSDPETANWIGDPEPFFTHGVWAADDDFKFLLAYGGRLYTWLGNQVVEWNPSGAKAGWRAIGLEGQNCWGAAIAGNMLVVAMTTKQGTSELWAFDGNGWWRINSVDLGSGQRICWPMHTGGAGNFDLVTFRDGNANVLYDLYRMIWRGDTAQTYSSTATWVSSLLDANERDKSKAWRKVGATFAAPEIRGVATSTDAVIVTLSYSIDGGKSVIQAATKTLTGGPDANRVVTLEGAIASAAAVSPFLQLQVKWSSVSDWAPVLVGVWAEFETLDNPARRRRWSFKVHARDGTVHRDGGVEARTGRQLAADLWQAWQQEATLTFRDLDDAADPVERNVRIVAIAEDVAKPADADQWGDSVISLQLIEV